MNEIIESHVRALYRLLNHGQDFTDCRCIDVNNPGSAPVSRRILNGEDQFVAWCREFNGKGNCFVGRNPRQSNGTVSRITTYSLDLDPPHAPRTSVSRIMVDRAVLAGNIVLQKWPGGYLAESGNGTLVVYRLAIPVVQKLEAFRQWLTSHSDDVQRVLAAGGLGDIKCDNTHDNERIIKIPGTLSVKGDKSNWRPARFVAVPCPPIHTVSWSGASTQEVGPLRAKNAPGWVSEVLGSLQEGNRNQSFTRVAGKLIGQHWAPEEILALLSPHAEKIGFDLKELQVIVTSVSRYAVSTARDDLDASLSVDAFLESQKKVEWVCEPIIARNSIGFVAGLPETMKTWLLIDLAVECARGGGKWLGLFPVKAARVLYVDQERFRGETQRRFNGVLRSKGIEPMSLKDSLYVRCGTTTRIDIESSYQAFRSELLRLKPDLVVVDSFATFHTRDDNSRMEVQSVMERIKSLRQDCGCSMVFVDHENKSVFTDGLDLRKGQRVEVSAFRMAGSVAKPAAAEFMLTVRRFDAQTSAVFHTKSTLSRTVPSFFVRVTDAENGGIQVRGEV